MTRIKSIKLQTIRGKRYFVAIDDKNRFLARRKVSGSGLSLQGAIDIYRRNKTFFPDKKRESSVLKNVEERVIYTETQKVLRKPSAKVVQYFVRAKIGGKDISARSKTLGSPGVMTRKQAKDKAFSNFYRRVDYEINGNVSSDEDRGRKYVTDNNVKITQGWVYYVPVKK